MQGWREGGELGKYTLVELLAAAHTLPAFSCWSGNRRVCRENEHAQAAGGSSLLRSSVLVSQPPPPDLDCADIRYRNFTVLPPDRHHFDGNNDGVGCEE
jgi:hypothetical protein